MVAFDFIKAILGRKFITKRIDGNFVLKEEQENQEITILEDEIDEIEVYKFANKDGDIDFPFFNKGIDTPRLLTKFCDYIVVCTRKQKLFVVLIELKTASLFGEAKKQIDAGEVFVRYIFNTFDRIKKQPTNYEKYIDIDKTKLNPKNIIKCVIISNKTTQTNIEKSIPTVANLHYDEGYYRCELPILANLQLKIVLRKS